DARRAARSGARIHPLHRDLEFGKFARGKRKRRKRNTALDLEVVMQHVVRMLLLDIAAHLMLGEQQLEARIECRELRALSADPECDVSEQGHESYSSVMRRGALLRKY